MKNYSLTHLSDESLRRELSAAAANENEATAELLAHIAEFDFRKLFLPAAFPSMLDYCMGELRLSEDAAKKRLKVARVGRECPGVFEALASGRVHLSGLVVLATHLSPGNAAELLAAATHKSREQIEHVVAERFPKLDVPAQVTAITDGGEAPCEEVGSARTPDMTLRRAESGAPGHPNLHARVSPLSAQAYAVQFTRSREADERFRRAQDLLGHQVATNDIAEVYDRAIKELVARLERTRCAATSQPQRAPRPAAGSRHVAADVRRVVWERDKGQCTYVSESGRRCEARRGLQFDHVKAFARGGEATPENLRLRCPGHNQHAAEQTYGAGFMAQKRQQAKEARARAKAERARIREEKERESCLLPHEEELVPWLGALGVRESEARIAAERCRDMPDAKLEDRVKRALSWFGDRISRKVMPVPEAASPPPGALNVGVRGHVGGAQGAFAAGE